MAIGNQHHTDIGIDHERLSRLRDIEFPETVKGYRKDSSQNSSQLIQSEIDEILRPNKSTSKREDNTQFYDKDLRRI